MRLSMVSVGTRHDNREDTMSRHAGPLLLAICTAFACGFLPADATAQGAGLKKSEVASEIRSHFGKIRSCAAESVVTSGMPRLIAS